MRSSLVVLTALVASLAPAAADDFGGWRFSAPKGYTTKEGATQIVMQKITPPTFCQLTLFSARAMTATLVDEALTEWKNIIASTFKASAVRHHGKGTTKTGIAFDATAANLEDASGNKSAAILYAVSTANMVGSVVLASSSSEDITKCRPALTLFLDSLTRPQAATPVADKPAALAITGSWANSASSVDRSTGASNNGSIKRQYTFGADGTYRFYSENWGGHNESETWRVVAESGTYTLTDTSLTLAPKTVIGTAHRKGTKSSYKPPVERTTYAVKKHYFEGLKEWNLVLTPTKKTARDGEFAGNADFNSSYLYSDQYKPEWRYPP